MVIIACHQPQSPHAHRRHTKVAEREWHLKFGRKWSVRTRLLIKVLQNLRGIKKKGALFHFRHFSFLCLQCKLKRSGCYKTELNHSFFFIILPPVMPPHSHRNAIKGTFASRCLFFHLLSYSTRSYVSKKKETFFFLFYLMAVGYFWVIHLDRERLYFPCLFCDESGKKWRDVFFLCVIWKSFQKHESITAAKFETSHLLWSGLTRMDRISGTVSIGMGDLTPYF